MASASSLQKCPPHHSVPLNRNYSLLGIFRISGGYKAFFLGLLICRRSRSQAVPRRPRKLGRFRFPCLCRRDRGLLVPRDLGDPGWRPTLPVGGPPPLSDSPSHGDPLDAERPVRASSRQRVAYSTRPRVGRVSRPGASPFPTDAR